MNNQRTKEERDREVLESLRFEALAMADAMYPELGGLVDELTLQDIAMALAIERGLLEDLDRET